MYFCCLAFSDLEGDLSSGCCHSHSRALSLLFGAVVCIVVVLLLDGGGLRLKSSPLFWDIVRVEASLEGHYLKL